MKLKRFGNILNHLVTTDMNFTQLDAYLTSQIRKRQVQYTRFHCLATCTPCIVAELWDGFCMHAGW